MSDQPTDPWGNPVPEGQRPPGPPGGDPVPPGAATPPPGWWQASDGRWYPPEAAPGGPPPPPQGPPPPAGQAGPGPQGDWWGAPAPGEGDTGWGQAAPGGAQAPPGWGPPPGGEVPPATGGWTPPPPGWGGYAGPPKRDGQAVGSLVMGIIALLCTGVIGIFLGVAAIVTGVLSRRRIRQSGGTLSGEGLATAGFVIGIIATILSTAFFIYVTFIDPDLVQDVLDQLTTTTTTPG